MQVRFKQKEKGVVLGKDFFGQGERHLDISVEFRAIQLGWSQPGLWDKKWRVMQQVCNLCPNLKVHCEPNAGE